VQNAGTVVVAAKAGKGSATLSMGFAGARLGNAVLAGLAGTPTTECAYVASNVTELPYFASKVTFGKKGVETVHPLGDLSPHEQARSPEVTRDHPRLPESFGHVVWRVSLHSPPPTSRGGSRRSRPSSRKKLTPGSSARYPPPRRHPSRVHGALASTLPPRGRHRYASRNQFCASAAAAPYPVCG